jgi:DNA modification methylase
METIRLSTSAFNDIGFPPCFSELSIPDDKENSNEYVVLLVALMNGIVMRISNFLRFTETMKVKLEKPIQFCSRASDIILDLFNGSASTLIAADQLGRVAYLQELDETYVDVGVGRYISYKNRADDVFLLRGGKRIPACDTGVFQS